jgi:hypothetical protein
MFSMIAFAWLLNQQRGTVYACMYEVNPLFGKPLKSILGLYVLNDRILAK